MRELLTELGRAILKLCDSNLVTNNTNCFYCGLNFVVGLLMIILYVISLSFVLPKIKKGKRRKKDENSRNSK